MQARISTLFEPEALNGIRVFSGGRDVVDTSEISQDERDAITYCFDQNIKKIENASPKIAAGLRLQREAMVKWAGIAKGTFPESKIYSYPGQAGGLGVDFLTPYLFGYGNSDTTGGLNMYLDTAAASATAAERTWDISLTAGTRTFLLGDLTSTFYKGCATTGSHSFVVLFQDGIVEIGSTPKIYQLHFKSELMNKYTPVGQQPLVSMPVEDHKLIYQYTTPGMIPCSHTTGMNISVMPAYTGTAHIPLLGMCFYETDFNVQTMVLH
jgi:hypothetical protein